MKSSVRQQERKQTPGGGGREAGRGDGSPTQSARAARASTSRAQVHLPGPGPHSQFGPRLLVTAARSPGRSKATRKVCLQVRLCTWLPSPPTMPTAAPRVPVPEWWGSGQGIGPPAQKGNSEHSPAWDLRQHGPHFPARGQKPRGKGGRSPPFLGVTRRGSSSSHLQDPGDVGKSTFLLLLSNQTSQLKSLQLAYTSWEIL